MSLDDQTKSGEEEITIEIPDYILDPEYAIGVGLISRDEYTTLRDEYYTQARTLTGVVIPLVGFMAALRWGSIHHWSWPVFFGIFVFGIAALVLGLDRLHKFYSELQQLIIGHYVKNKLAEKDAAATAAKVLTKKQLDDELTKKFKEQDAELKKKLDEQLAAIEKVIKAKEPDKGSKPGGGAAQSAT